MNVHEDYLFYIKKKLQSKDYIKDHQKILRDIRTKTLKAEAKGSGKEADATVESQVNQEFPNYSSMTKEQIDSVIEKYILPKFKSWV